jgi:nucleotide-binding universal stress UspA family protein
VTTSSKSSHRIVVGIDGSGSSLRALDWAGGQAQLTGARLEVLVAWSWPTNYGWSAPFPEGYDPEVAVNEMLEGVVADLARDFPEVVVEPAVVESHPAVALVEASREADLLVVGSRGHGEFSGMVLGSVSEYCVGHAHCPVLVVRPNGSDKR